MFSKKKKYRNDRGSKFPLNSNTTNYGAFDGRSKEPNRNNSDMSSSSVSLKSISNDSPSGNGSQQPVFEFPSNNPIKVSSHSTVADMADSIVIDFNEEPFQFYTRESENTWKASILQATCLLCICFFVPALLLGIILLIAKCCNQTKKRRPNDKKESMTHVALFVAALIKDSIAATLVLHVVFGSPASSYEIAYSPVLYTWCLLSFVYPLFIFNFADIHYEFGFASGNPKTLKKLLSALVNMRTKEEETKKLSDQEKYFQNNYKALSSIRTVFDELSFLVKVTARPLLIMSLVISVIICSVHSVVPLTLYECISCLNYTGDDNVTVYLHATNSTDRAGLNLAIIGLSVLNSFVVSMMAAAYFIYLILWRVANLGEWKRFNTTEEMADKTLINNGPQGIAMWWKIYQTLQFFSQSPLCASVMIGNLACVVSVIFIACQSLGLVYPVISPDCTITKNALALFLSDNIFLYIALIILGIMNIMIGREKNSSIRILLLKKINISYELSSMLTIEPKLAGREQNVPLRVRGLKGCLTLLQELTFSLGSMEGDNSLRYFVPVCITIATLCVIPSTFIGVRYIMLE